MASNDVKIFSMQENGEVVRAIKLDTYANFRGEIAAFSSLPKGWDSYSAEPPSATAVERAKEFVTMAERHSFKIEWVAPTSDDSVMVTLETRLARQEWDFYSDGDIAVTILERSGEKRFLDVERDGIERVLSGDYGVV